MSQLPKKLFSLSSLAGSFLDTQVIGTVQILDKTGKSVKWKKWKMEKSEFPPKKNLFCLFDKAPPRQTNRPKNLRDEDETQDTRQDKTQKRPSPSPRDQDPEATKPKP
jgi:hypothetical protein